MHCFKTQMESGSLKESLISFLLVDKDKENLLAEKFAISERTLNENSPQKINIPGYIFLNTNS